MRQPGHAPNCKCEDCEGQTGIDEEIEWMEDWEGEEMRPYTIEEVKLVLERQIKDQYHHELFSWLVREYEWRRDRLISLGQGTPREMDALDNKPLCTAGLEEEIEWIKLGELRPGAIFETRKGVRAVKTEYHTFNNERECDCYLLESGEAAHFPDGDSELVRELTALSSPAPTAPAPAPLPSSPAQPGAE